MLHLHHFTFNPFSENTYVLFNEQRQCWIIDPGMFHAQEVSEIMGFLKSESLTPQGILNTHAHIDHVLGIAALQEQYQIPFSLHSLDLPVLQAAPASALLFGLPSFSVPQPDHMLTDGQQLSLGDDILEVLHLPGHSPGSVGFYYPKGQWLLGGDVLFEGSVGRTDLPGGDADTLFHSIRTRLYALPENTTIWPGHGSETTIGREKRSNPFVQA